MSCFHPNLFVFEGFSVETGKPSYRFIGPWTDKIEEDFICNNYDEHEKWIKIPCGKCAGCKMDYAKTWADRMMMELPYHDESYFVTLTYDNEHLPIQDDGHGNLHATLVKSDVSEFMKRLRSALAYKDLPKVRFYACGEYGGQTFRPHYHLIIFGLHLDDLLPNGKNPLGDQYFESKFLDSIWSKGYVSVGSVTYESCAYVGRYVTKKMGESRLDYDLLGILPEFTLMSRKPGIGYEYIMDHLDKIYETDEIHLKTEKKGVSFRPPRYADKQLEKIDPEKLKGVKVRRIENADSAHYARMVNSELSYSDLLTISERNFINKTKALERRLYNETSPD